MIRPVLAALALALSGCILPAPPPAPVPPEILPDAAVARPRPALLDPLVGRYSSGAEAITIRRAGDGLVAERPGRPAAPLTFVGSGTFADALGATYLFSGGQRLSVIAADGSRREWIR